MHFYGDINKDNYDVNIFYKNKISKTYDNNTYDIAFVGRLYNRKEIIIDHDNIENLSDSELVLLTYIKYGYDAFEIIDGSYSLIIYDYAHNLVILARDRFGTMPLYYTHSDDKCIFSSNISNILNN